MLNESDGGDGQEKGRERRTHPYIYIDTCLHVSTHTQLDSRCEFLVFKAFSKTVYTCVCVCVCVCVCSSLESIIGGKAHCYHGGNSRESLIVRQLSRNEE